MAQDILVNRQNLKVFAESVPSTDVKNVDWIAEMPGYSLVSERYIVDNVKCVDDETGDITEYDGPDQIMFFKKKSLRLAFLLELCQMYFAIPLVALTQGGPKTDRNMVCAGSMVAENEVSYRYLVEVGMKWSYQRIWYDCTIGPSRDLRVRVCFGI